MKKENKREGEFITRGILKFELKKEINRAVSPLKKADAKLREDMHAMEFRLVKRMDGMDQRFDRIDQRFDHIDEVLRKYLDTVMGLADKVVVAHTNFEGESASIRYNYNQLEGRVKKVEEVVFPV